MARKQSSENMHQLIKLDRLNFSASEDNVMLKQIEATHVPDGGEFNVKPLLRLVEEILTSATANCDAIFNGLDLKARDVKVLEDAAYQIGFLSMVEALAPTIDRISCEIRSKCTAGEGAHQRAISVLSMLSGHHWDAKLALTLSAFAINYGEFWLVFQSYNSNHLAKSMAILKQLPQILERSSLLKPRFNLIKDLIKVMLDVGKCIVEFRELPSQYITPDVSALSTALSHMPVAVYWAIRCVVACATQIAILRGLQGDEHLVSTSESWELSTLVHKVSNMHSHLKDLLDDCRKYVEEKKHMEAYQALLNLFEMTHTDNMKVLGAFIYAEDDQEPLFEGGTDTDRRINIDVLKHKYVLLLISNLDISHDELEVLENIYRESRAPSATTSSQYEIVWLPIIDQSDPWVEKSKKLLENHRKRMPWYTVYDPLRVPSLKDRTVIRFIKEKWKYGRKPILVVLDPQGQVVCPNALYMMWIWRNDAFPFTIPMEEALWEEATWNLEFLVDAIDPLVSDWIKEGRIICLYGGDDTEWIEKFTTAAREVEQSAGVSMEMVYVGKSDPKERVYTNIANIADQGHRSHSLKDLTSVWYFWARLKSMWYSKQQLGKTAEKDPTMQQVMEMLSLDSGHEGWAMVCEGSVEIAKAKGRTFLTCLLEHNQWKAGVQFLQALKDHLLQVPATPHHCNQLELLLGAGMIPDTLKCSECGRKMEKYILYRCCDV